MAYTPAMGDVLILTAACTQGDQAGMNTCFYQVSAIVGAGVTDTFMAAHIDNLLKVPYKNLLGSNASYYGVRLARYAPGPTTLPAISALYTGIGTAATTCMANQVSGLIKGKAGFAGARFRARNYIPFPYLGATDPVLNVPTAGYKSLLLALASATYTPYVIPNGLDSTTIIPVIYHRDTGLTDQILTYAAGNKWATQKRRGNFGRPNTYPPF